MVIGFSLVMVPHNTMESILNVKMGLPGGCSDRYCQDNLMVRMRTYKTRVRSVMEYSPLAWVGTAPTTLKKLDTIQDKEVYKKDPGDEELVIREVVEDS
eukprot:g29732.t1